MESDMDNGCYGFDPSELVRVAVEILSACLDPLTGEYVPINRQSVLRGPADSGEVLREVLWWLTCAAQGESADCWRALECTRQIEAYYDEKSRGDQYVGD